MRQQLRLHASHGPHPGEEHRKDGNSGYRFRIFANEWACEAFYPRTPDKRRQREGGDAGRSRPDRYRDGNRRTPRREPDIECDAAVPRTVARSAIGMLKPEYSGEGDAGWTHGDQRPEEQPLRQFRPGRVIIIQASAMVTWSSGLNGLRSSLSWPSSTISSCLNGLVMGRFNSRMALFTTATMTRRRLLTVAVTL